MDPDVQEEDPVQWMTGINVSIGAATGRGGGGATPKLVGGSIYFAQFREDLHTP